MANIIWTDMPFVSSEIQKLDEYCKRCKEIENQLNIYTKENPEGDNIEICHPAADMRNNLGDLHDLAHNIMCCFTDLQTQFKSNFPIRPLSSAERINVWWTLRDSFKSAIGNIESLLESIDAVCERLQNVEENFFGSESVSTKIQNHLAKLKAKMPNGSLLNDEIQTATTSGQHESANYPASSHEHLNLANSDSKFVQVEVPKSTFRDVQSAQAEPQKTIKMPFTKAEMRKLDDYYKSCREIEKEIGSASDMKKKIREFHVTALVMRQCFSAIQQNFERNVRLYSIHSSSGRKFVWWSIRNAFSSTIFNIDSLSQSIDDLYENLTNVEEFLLGPNSTSGRIQNELSKLQTNMPSGSVCEGNRVSPTIKMKPRNRRVKQHMHKLRLPSYAGPYSSSDDDESVVIESIQSNLEDPPSTVADPSTVDQPGKKISNEANQTDPENLLSAPNSFFSKDSDIEYPVYHDINEIRPQTASSVVSMHSEYAKLDDLTNSLSFSDDDIAFIPEDEPEATFGLPISMVDQPKNEAISKEARALIAKSTQILLADAEETSETTTTSRATSTTISSSSDEYVHLVDTHSDYYCYSSDDSN